MKWVKTYYEPTTGRYFLNMNDDMYARIKCFNDKIDAKGPASINDALNAFQLWDEVAEDSEIFNRKCIVRVTIGQPKFGLMESAYYPLVYSFIAE